MDRRQTILVVEDSDEHFESMCRAFARTDVSNPVRRCADGDEAIDYLRRRGRYADPEDAPRPAVTLLDLNLPGTDGREVLQEIKADPELMSMPVVVLTTSASPGDIELCYRIGASSYIVKPIRFEDFLKSIRTLGDYWFETVALPPA